MEDINVSAVSREQIGVKGALSKTRADKKIPAVVYGGTKPSAAITIASKDLGKLFKMGNNTIVHLDMGGSKDTVLLKTVQYHAVSGAPVHADFIRVDMNAKIEIKVHVQLNGESTGVKNKGAILDHALREIVVRCLPKDIPHQIDVDITNLDLGSPIHVKDVKFPAGIEVLGDMDRVVAHLMMPREEVVEATPAPGAAEPEIVAAKGKKEEEGAEGAAKDGKAAPAAKDGKAAAGKAPAGKASEKK